MAKVRAYSTVTKRHIGSRLKRIDEYVDFKNFVELYYKWVEERFIDDKREETAESGKYFTIDSLETMMDIDKCSERFLHYYKESLAKGFAEETKADFRKVLQTIDDLFTAKGTDKAVKYFFRAVYGKESGLEYPIDDLLIPSASRWFKEHVIYIYNPSGFPPSYFKGKLLYGIKENNGIADLASIKNPSAQCYIENAEVYEYDQYHMRLYCTDFRGDDFEKYDIYKVYNDQSDRKDEDGVVKYSLFRVSKQIVDWEVVEPYRNLSKNKSYALEFIEKENKTKKILDAEDWGSVRYVPKEFDDWNTDSLQTSQYYVVVINGIEYPVKNNTILYKGKNWAVIDGTVTIESTDDFYIGVFKVPAEATGECYIESIDDVGDITETERLLVTVQGNRVLFNNKEWQIVNDTVVIEVPVETDDSEYKEPEKPVTYSVETRYGNADSIDWGLVSNPVTVLSEEVVSSNTHRNSDYITKSPETPVLIGTITYDPKTFSGQVYNYGQFGMNGDRYQFSPEFCSFCYAYGNGVPIKDSNGDEIDRKYVFIDRNIVLDDTSNVFNVEVKYRHYEDEKIIHKDDKHFYIDTNVTAEIKFFERDENNVINEISTTGTSASLKIKDNITEIEYSVSANGYKTIEGKLTKNINSVYLFLNPIIKLNRKDTNDSIICKEMNGIVYYIDSDRTIYDERPKVTREDFQNRYSNWWNLRCLFDRIADSEDLGIYTCLNVRQFPVGVTLKDAVHINTKFYYIYDRKSAKTTEYTKAEFMETFDEVEDMYKEYDVIDADTSFQQYIFEYKSGDPHRPTEADRIFSVDEVEYYKDHLRDIEDIRDRFLYEDAFLRFYEGKELYTKRAGEEQCVGRVKSLRVTNIGNPEPRALGVEVIFDEEYRYKTLAIRNLDFYVKTQEIDYVPPVQTQNITQQILENIVKKYPPLYYDSTGNLTYEEPDNYTEGKVWAAGHIYPDGTECYLNGMEYIRYIIDDDVDDDQYASGIYGYKYTYSLPDSKIWYQKDLADVVKEYPPLYYSIDKIINDNDNTETIVKTLNVIDDPDTFTGVKVWKNGFVYTNGKTSNTFDDLDVIQCKTNAILIPVTTKDNNQFVLINDVEYPVENKGITLPVIEDINANQVVNINGSEYPVEKEQVQIGLKTYPVIDNSVFIPVTIDPTDNKNVNGVIYIPLDTGVYSYTKQEVLPDDPDTIIYKTFDIFKRPNGYVYFHYDSYGNYIGQSGDDGFEPIPDATLFVEQDEYLEFYDIDYQLVGVEATQRGKLTNYTIHQNAEDFVEMQEPVVGNIGPYGKSSGNGCRIRLHTKYDTRGIVPHQGSPVTSVDIFSGGSLYDRSVSVKGVKGTNIELWGYTVGGAKDVNTTFSMCQISPSFAQQTYRFRDVGEYFDINDPDYDESKLEYYQGEYHQPCPIVRPIVGNVLQTTGYFDDRLGIIGESSYIQDFHYYQLFSYVLTIENTDEDTLNKQDYIDLFKKFLHPAGYKMFERMKIMSENIGDKKIGGNISKFIQVWLWSQHDYLDVYDGVWEPHEDYRSTYDIRPKLNIREGLDISYSDDKMVKWLKGGGNDLWEYVLEYEAVIPEGQIEQEPDYPIMPTEHYLHPNHYILAEHGLPQNAEYHEGFWYGNDERVWVGRTSTTEVQGKAEEPLIMIDSQADVIYIRGKEYEFERIPLPEIHHTQMVKMVDFPTVNGHGYPYIKHDKTTKMSVISEYGTDESTRFSAYFRAYDYVVENGEIHQLPRPERFDRPYIRTGTSEDAFCVVPYVNRNKLDNPLHMYLINGDTQLKFFFDYDYGIGTICWWSKYFTNIQPDHVFCTNELSLSQDSSIKETVINVDNVPLPLWFRVGYFDDSIAKYRMRINISKKEAEADMMILQYVADVDGIEYPLIPEINGAGYYITIGETKYHTDTPHSVFIGETKEVVSDSITVNDTVYPVKSYVTINDVDYPVVNGKMTYKHHLVYNVKTTDIITIGDKNYKVYEDGTVVIGDMEYKVTDGTVVIDDKTYEVYPSVKIEGVTYKVVNDSITMNDVEYPIIDGKVYYSFDRDYIVSSDGTIAFDLYLYDNVANNTRAESIKVIYPVHNDVISDGLLLYRGSKNLIPVGTEVETRLKSDDGNPYYLFYPVYKGDVTESISINPQTIKYGNTALFKFSTMLYPEEEATIETTTYFSNGTQDSLTPVFIITDMDEDYRYAGKTY